MTAAACLNEPAEKLILLLLPPLLLPDIMSGRRIAYPSFFRIYHIVTGKIRMRRADRVLKAYCHEHRACYPVRKVLDIKIAESAVKVVFTDSLFPCRRKNRVGRPVHKREIVPVVIKERDRRGDGLDSSVKRCYNKSKRAPLALTICKDTGSVGDRKSVV